MPRRFISDWAPGERIEDQVFLVSAKDLRQTNQGSLYIHAVLVDRSGQVPARMWQANEALFSAIPQGGFVRFKGRTENYKGALQFIIEAIRPVEDVSKIDLSEFLPKTEHDVEAMFARVTEILAGIKNEHVAALVRQYLEDEELMRRFKTAPAAIQMHHAYIGGLLEHTLAVLELGLMVIPRYPKVSLDLVLAGIFLHDLAKTTELTYLTSFGYTDEGQLVGHVAIGAVWIELKAAAVAEATGQPFPDEIKWVLQHIILAHHGKYEFGSPKLPAVPEAVAIHYLDNLDAKLHQYRKEIEGNRDPQSHWTNYRPALETKVFKPAVLGDRPD
ncbi:MAG: HD domain-containing protein [Planctomycetes bacterium]|nr:HD domain-containing protein [Planctomycetota bacterium]